MKKNFFLRNKLQNYLIMASCLFTCISYTNITKSKDKVQNPNTQNKVDLNKVNQNNVNINTISTEKENTKKNNPEKTFEDTVFEWSGTLAEIFRVAGEKHFCVDRADKSFIKAADAFLKNLDPHSSFLDPKTYKSILETTSGQFFGIGIVIDNTRSTKEKFLTAINTVPGGPAEQAGVLPFDKIIEIDDKKIDGMTTEEASAKLKGPKNTVVKIKVLRENKKEPISFDITRNVVKAKTSFAFYIKDYDVYYVCLTTFSSTALKQIQNILEKSSKKPYKGLIIDLRNNSGGLLTSVIDISGLFLEKNSLVVTTKDKNGIKKDEYKTTSDPVANANIPIFILVNNYTASASEILAGCLKIHSQNSSKNILKNLQNTVICSNPKNQLGQLNPQLNSQISSPMGSVDNVGHVAQLLSPINTISGNPLTGQITTKDNNDSGNLLAFIVGSKTFGKGSVQEIIPISNNCAIKLTTCLYFLPDDSTIQGKGIEPDFVVEKLFPAPEKITWFLDHYGREKSLKHSINPMNNNLNKEENKSKEKATKWDKKLGEKSNEKLNIDKNKENQKSWTERTKDILMQDNQFIETLQLINTFNLLKEKSPEKVIDRKTAIKSLKEISALESQVGMEEISGE